MESWERICFGLYFGFISVLYFELRKKYKLKVKQHKACLKEIERLENENLNCLNNLENMYHRYEKFINEDIKNSKLKLNVIIESFKEVNND